LVLRGLFDVGGLATVTTLTAYGLSKGARFLNRWRRRHAEKQQDEHEGATENWATALKVQGTVLETERKIDQITGGKHRAIPGDGEKSFLEEYDEVVRDLNGMEERMQKAIDAAFEGITRNIQNKELRAAVRRTTTDSWAYETGQFPVLVAHS